MAFTAITPITLEADTFALKVLERNLKVEGPLQGFIYAMEGEKLYRTYEKKRYFWHYKSTFKQTNAAGGAIVVTITNGDQTAMRLVSMRCENSGNNGVGVRPIGTATTADYQGVWASVGAAAGTNLNLPTSGTASSSSANMSTSENGLVVGNNSRVVVYQTGAGVQNDELLVIATFELLTNATAPSIDKSGSTNAADVTITEALNEVTTVPVIA